MQGQRTYTLSAGLSVSRIQPEIGAVVSGVDLRQPLTEAQVVGLKQALFAHGVIFLRRQEASGFPEQLRLAEAFGTPECEGSDPERPQITPVSAKPGSLEGTAAAWHSDGMYMPAPTSVSILRAVEPCTFGGDTCFASGVAAYAGLPAELKQQIATLRFSSSLGAVIPEGYDYFGSGENWDELNAKYPPVTQPVVLVHPETGARVLYVSSVWAQSIVGMDEEEGRALINRLAIEFTRPEYQMRWQWEEGAIAIWDNRQVMHYGVPDQTTHRYLERVTVEGEALLSIADWEARQEKVVEGA